MHSSVASSLNYWITRSYTRVMDLFKKTSTVAFFNINIKEFLPVMAFNNSYHNLFFFVSRNPLIPVKQEIRTGN